MDHLDRASRLRCISSIEAARDFVLIVTVIQASNRLQIFVKIAVMTIKITLSFAYCTEHSTFSWSIALWPFIDKNYFDDNEKIVCLKNPAPKFHQFRDFHKKLNTMSVISLLEQIFIECYSTLKTQNFELIAKCQSWFSSKSALFWLLIVIFVSCSHWAKFLWDSKKLWTQMVWNFSSRESWTTWCCVTSPKALC